MQILKSKTMIFGMAVAALGAVQMFLPSVESLFTPETYGALTSAIGAVIMILRAVTTTSISEK